MTDVSTDDPLTVDGVESHLAAVADGLARVGAGECLFCYLVRVLGLFGCEGSHAWTRRWVAARGRGHGWVLPWVKRNGGCCCDCEVVMNALHEDEDSARHRQLRCDASYAEDPDGLDDDELDDELDDDDRWDR
jgi:hypothetical protein